MTSNIAKISPNAILCDAHELVLEAQLFRFAITSKYGKMGGYPKWILSELLSEIGKGCLKRSCRSHQVNLNR